MATVILHVGMSKTGSSSIQRWLGENLSFLRERGIDCLRARRGGTGPISVLPAEPGRARSQNPFLGVRDHDDRVTVLRELVEQLDAQASRHDAVVVTNEGFELLVQSEDKRLREPLEVLARDHRVRVVYYVRPQDTWLEAAWRQWGFRHPWRPSKWLRRQEPRVRYLRTLDRVRAEAPSVAFEMRPFRSDLFVGGEVVSDFAAAVLGCHDAPALRADDGRSNRGFPLELSILLRAAPPGMFWASLHDNRTLDRLKRFVLAWDDGPESESVARSRAVLRRYCTDTYEPENRMLVETLGWRTDHFVTPAAPALDVVGDLVQIDDLWSPSASEGERQLIFRALAALVESE